MEEVCLLYNSLHVHVMLNQGTFFPESSQQNEFKGELNSCVFSMRHQAELTGRNSGFDLQRELIEGVFIHH